MLTFNIVLVNRLQLVDPGESSWVGGDTLQCWFRLKIASTLQVRSCVYVYVYVTDHELSEECTPVGSQSCTTINVQSHSISEARKQNPDFYSFYKTDIQQTFSICRRVSKSSSSSVIIFNGTSYSFGHST